MNSDRMSTLSAAFRAVPLQCGPHVLRPITAGSILLLMDTGNSLFSESAAAATESASLQGIFEFIWIHTAPEEEVIEDCSHPDLLRVKARKLALSIGFDDLAAFTAQFDEIRTRLNASVVDILPEKGDVGKPAAETPVPTGSPLSSTPSVAVETRSGSAGSSGASPSIEPSSMSTPPMPQTEPAPAGRSRIWEPEPEDEPRPLAKHVIPLP